MSHDDIDAILGASLPEPDAPVKTTRQSASAVPASKEIELDAPVKSWREMFEDGLRMQVHAVLSDHELADVEISIDGARVALHGKVPDELTYQLVEDLAWSVPAVRQCDNFLRVTG